jgi:hypothetical protein
MAGPVPAIHVMLAAEKTWMRGTSPRMTIERNTLRRIRAQANSGGTGYRMDAEAVSRGLMISTMRSADVPGGKKPIYFPASSTR